MTLYEMQRERNNYYNLKDNVKSIINYLNSTIDSLTLVINNFNSAYSVDDGSIGKVETINQKENLIGRRDTLNSQIIPSINYMINKLSKMIEEEQTKLT